LKITIEGLPENTAKGGRYVIENIDEFILNTRSGDDCIVLSNCCTEFIIKTILKMLEKAGAMVIPSTRIPEDIKEQLIEALMRKKGRMN